MKPSKQYDAETTRLPDYRLTCFFGLFSVTAA